MDTDLLLAPPPNPPSTKEEQLIWLNNTLQFAEPSDWTIVIGHKPIRSCGDYGPGYDDLVTYVVPILEHHAVDFFMNGHDHNLQHIRKNDTSPPEYVISGGGSRALYSFEPAACDDVHRDGHTLEFFAERFGFVGFLAEKNTFTVTFYGDAGSGGVLEELHSFTKSKP